MNIKLLLASLIGVGSIGGAVAGGYYISQGSNKQPNTATDNQAKTDAQASQTPLTNPKSEPTVPKEPAPTTPKQPGTSGGSGVGVPGAVSPA